MSLVRFGQDESSVYVFNGATSGKIECCCAENFKCDYDDEMAAHLRQHQSWGHTVPSWVFDILEGRDSKAFYIPRRRTPPSKESRR